ncbi:hypothetical protein [Nitrosomonas sp. Nm33]|uniref:hypothetical protein n=1 Tax=Nitrosomonas sp. Nm33 TaxID=133724 RepID=UPI000899F1E3|nr:hypothetical protein [Nitrosomonas sp. Nm33]SDY12353.1 hypothetical protein SAMN05421755_100828 [Nitrosomonas sp. Nm33]
MAKFDTGIFHPPDSGSTPLPGLPVWFAGAVHYFNVGSDGSTLYDAICNSPFDDVTAPTSWSNGKIDEDQVGAKVETGFPPAPLVLGSHLYLFWIDEDWEYVAVTRAGSDRKWCSYVILHDTSGATIGNENSPVAATALDDSRILVMVVDADSARWCVFNVEDFQAGQPWTARSESRAYANDYKPLVLSSVRSLTFELTSHGLGLTIFTRDGGLEANGYPSTYVVAGVTCRVDGIFQTLVCLLQTDARGLPRVTDLSAGWLVYSWDGSVSLVRDPGGRVRMDYLQPGPQTQLLSTANTPPSWSEPTKWLPGTVVPIVRPTCCFVTRAHGPLEFQASFWSFFQGPSGLSEEIGCWAYEYGTLRRMVGVDVIDLTKVAQDQKGVGLRALRGFIDGPPPVLAVNVASNPTKLVGNVAYGATSSSTQAFTTVQDWVFGVKTEGQLKLGPVSPAWEASFKLGTGETFTESKVQTSITSMKLTVTADGTVVAPLTAVFVGDIYLHADAFEFVPSGQTEPVTDGPQYNALYTEFGGPLVRPTNVFTATPGDLASYTWDAWNARMKAAGISDDYMTDVIEPRALVVGQGGLAPQLLDVQLGYVGIDRYTGGARDDDVPGEPVVVRHVGVRRRQVQDPEDVRKRGTRRRELVAAHHRSGHLA